MIEGTFVGSDKPVVKAIVAWGQAIQAPNFVLDTGFTGDLVVSKQIATDLGLSIDGVMKVSLAGSSLIEKPTASAIAVMEGQRLLVTAIIIEEGWPLLGISFMEKFGYKAIVDCKNKKVRLEVAE
jgi:predicted aspartyl protease